MKNLKEMNGVEAIEIFVEHCGPDALDRLALAFGEDIKFLSHNTMGKMIDKVFSAKELFSAERRKDYTEKYVAAFFAILGINNSQEINEIELIEKSLEIGGSETADHIFSSLLQQDLDKIKQLPSKIKKLLLERQYGKDITFEDLFATKTFSFADPNVEAATKLLFEA